MGILFKAIDHQGNILSVVISRSKQLALAYWQGAGLFPNQVEELDFPEDHPTGVVPVLNTEEVPVSRFQRMSFGATVRIIAKP